LDKHTQAVLKDYIKKVWRNVWEEGYSIIDDKTPEERKVIGGMDDPLFSYAINLADMERALPPQKRVSLDTFYIARFPITHAQADKFFQSNYARQYKLDQRRVRPLDFTDDLPEEIDWEPADALAHWLGGRLPTIYEWEKAARGTDERLYPWGDEWNIDFGNVSMTGTRYVEGLETGLTPVDWFPKGVSPYGVWDMLGNLSEWTCTIGSLLPNETSPVVMAKGESYKNPGPEWFYAMIPRNHPDARLVGMRPVLSERQYEDWSNPL
jgi:formylglycine-generating enzyme required for sulfatase activity